MLLTIRSHADQTTTTLLVRDVAHTHPAWVHDQLETGSESELQSFLGGLQEQDYLAAALKAGRWQDRRDYADDTGIYHAGPVYRVTSSFVDAFGVEFWNHTHEALGDYYGRLFADEDAAQKAADDLTDDLLVDDSTVSYAVERVA